MISTKPKTREYYWATLFVANEQMSFRYSLERDENKMLNQPFQNLVGATKTMAIRTSWDLPFKTNLTVEIDGEKYKITNCQKLKTTINECANRIFRPHNTFWYLDLTR